MFEIIPMSYLPRSYRNPFREMDLIARSFFSEPFFSEKENIRPFKTDVIKTEDGFMLEAELPGFKKEEISLNLEGDILTVKAEKNSENEASSEKDKFVRVERTRSSFERRFDVSEIDAEKIEAKYENGILLINMPSRVSETPPSRQISIA